MALRELAVYLRYTCTRKKDYRNNEHQNLGIIGEIKTKWRCVCMKTIKTLRTIEVRDRVENVAERIQSVCLLLDNLHYLETVSDSVSVYSEHPDVKGDMLSMCVSELLSAADKLNTLWEDCSEYDLEVPELHETK